MKHKPYHTKRFWKLVEKEFKTNTNTFGSPYIYICHGSPIFKEQWQSADFHAFCRLHGQTVLGDDIIYRNRLWVAGALCLGGRAERLRFLAHMVKTISLRTRKSL